MTTATLAPKAATRRPDPLARQIRDWHAYLGALIAPTVLFFATTGVVQLWSLHEAHGGYHPPDLIEKLGSLHKDQKFALGHHHEPPAAKPGVKTHKPASEPEAAPKPAILLLKAFFTAVAVSLIVSTVAGIWMALSQSPRRRTLAILLLIGAVTPAILAALSA